MSRPLPMPSPLEYELIQLLIPMGEAYGLEIVKGSKGRIKRGSAYVVLGRMEKKGLVVSFRKESLRPLYKVTKTGALAARKYEAVQQLLKAPARAFVRE